MPTSRSCPQCLFLLTEQTADNICPACGSVVPPLAGETPKSQETPREGETEFAVGPQTNVDPDATRTRLESTLPQGRPFERSRLLVPDIPNHTDFELLGQGGMGIVYRAVQRPTDRPVAVKVMLNFTPASPTRDRFVNEVRALAKLKHPGIVPIFEAGECSLGPYFTMELIPGRTLAQRLQAGPIEAKEAARLMADAADAVHAAHLADIIHRDIKPSNILLDLNGSVRVADFGLAKHVGGDDTVTGVVVGTPAYMAPEQADLEAGAVTKLADVYGLGGTLFHLVTGHIPHNGPTPAATLRKKAADPTPQPLRVCPALCPTLAAIITRSMAKDPAERFPSAAALASDLRKWAAGEETVTKPLTRRQRLRRRLRRNRVVLAAMAVLLLMVAGGAYAVRESDVQRRIDRALERGEKVVLVGPTGKPLTKRWHIGGERPLNDQASPDLACGFEATLTEAFLILLEDPMVSHYRLTAEVRQDKAADPDGYVGIGLGLTTPAVPGLENVSRWTQIVFAEDWTSLELRDLEQRRLHGIRWQDRILFWDSDRLRAGDVRGPRFSLFAPRTVPVAAWHKFVIDVTPEGLRVWTPQLDEAEEGVVRSEPALSLKRGELDEMITLQARNHRIDLTGAPAASVEWNPRRPLGIVASESSVSFRNVAVHPLPK